MKQIDFVIGNQYVSDNSTMANSFTNYFTNIEGSLAKTIKSDNDPLVFLHTTVNSINIPEITFHEVAHIISNMNNSSIMKQCVETYVKQLTLYDYNSGYFFLIN